jgi:hypothetical protein
MGSPTAQPWIGWHRPTGDAWREVCRANTEYEAWDKLLDLATPGDKAVLPRGKRPEERPRQRSLFSG